MLNMITIIDELIKNSKNVTFPIKITSEVTRIKYIITKINDYSIFYRQLCGSTYSSERESAITNWNLSFLIQLNALLKELQQGNIWED